MSDSAPDDVERLRARVRELEQQLERLADAEEQVLGARAQSEALLDNIPYMAWMKSVSGAFLAVNEPFAKAAGRSKLELLGRTDKDVWPPELADRYVQDDQRVIESGAKVFVEEPIADGDGIKWFETFKTPIRDRRGNVVGTVGLARDITERKRAEEERQTLERHLRETQKLESLGVLAGGIAHDFNNLLVGVLSNAELAVEALAGMTLAEEARERIADVRTAALHAAELTNQMLAYSGKGHFVVRPICLNDVIREMTQLLSASISKKARVRYDLAASLPAVLADVAQVQQLIMNLLTNASDALEERAGRIDVRTGVEAIRETPSDLYGPTPLAPGRYVFFEVSDDGCGMDEATRARLFEPFFTTKFTGRGLGLSVVQGMVRGHNGGIVLQTERGRGTTFKVLLPATEQPAVAPADSERVPASEWTASGLALLVDDDARVRNVTELLLKTIGFDVLSISSGREAIREFDSHADEVRLVLLDMTMPDLNGEQVLQELRRLRPDVPVLLCSGYSEPEIRGRFEPQTTIDFIQKPYSFEVLRSRIRRVLERR